MPWQLDWTRPRVTCCLNKKADVAQVTRALQAACGDARWDEVRELVLEFRDGQLAGPAEAQDFVVALLLGMIITRPQLKVAVTCQGTAAAHGLAAHLVAELGRSLAFPNRLLAQVASPAVAAQWLASGRLPGG